MSETPAHDDEVAAVDQKPPEQPPVPSVEPLPPKPTVVDYKQVWAPLPIKQIIMAEYNYIVFINDEDELGWQITPAHDAVLDDLPDAQFSTIFNRAAQVRTMPVEYLTAAQRLNFRWMIGEGLARLFEEHPLNHSLQMLDDAQAYATARNQEIARGWQLKATGITAGCFLVLDSHPVGNNRARSLRGSGSS